jgi:hypothetical protein
MTRGIVMRSRGPYSQLGRTIDLFDWTGVTPTGAFNVSSPYTWNLSKLYTTGEVTLLNLLMPGDFNGDGLLSGEDLGAMFQALVNRPGYEKQTGLIEDELKTVGDLNGDGAFNNGDIQALLYKLNHPRATNAAATVPEPASISLLLTGAFAGLVIIRTSRRGACWHPFGARWRTRFNRANHPGWCHELVCV